MVKHWVITVPVLIEAGTDEEMEEALDQLVGDITAQACEPEKHSPYSWRLDGSVDYRQVV